MSVEELIKIAGGLTGAGLIFVIFYLYLQATTKAMGEIINKNFEILKTLIDQNAVMLGYIQEIKALAANNLWCPYIRKNAKGGTKNE